MMNVLGCLDIPTYGEYFLEGTDIGSLSDKELARIRNREIGFIFFKHMLTRFGVQCAGRLIGHDDGGRGGDGPGNKKSSRTNLRRWIGNESLAGF